MNLSTNASTAMEERGGTLEINLTDAFYSYLIDDQECSAGYLQLTVKDTGIGMTREMMQKAFDPFFTSPEKPERAHVEALYCIRGRLLPGPGNYPISVTVKGC